MNNVYCHHCAPEMGKHFFKSTSSDSTMVMLMVMRIIEHYTVNEYLMAKKIKFEN